MAKKMETGKDFSAAPGSGQGLWDDAHARQLAGDEVELLLYRSNLLGSDLRLTNYGGGNTSCKTTCTDPLSDEPVEVMWVKGSGGDLGTLKRNGLASLYMERLTGLKRQYKGLDQEDKMVELFNYCIFDPSSKAPSIDTALHAFLPFRHIDHLHPDSVIAIAAAKDGQSITEKLFAGEVGWIPWQRPGFDLGLKLSACVQQHPGIRGIILGSHGLFTWGDTSLSCYRNSLDVINRCATFLQENLGKRRPVFGGVKVESTYSAERLSRAAALAPVLRGQYQTRDGQPSPGGRQGSVVGHFSDDDRVLQFINSQDLDRLAPMGTSCPDHFLRTKICPLVLNLESTADLQDVKALNATVAPQFTRYRTMYSEYYRTHKHSNSPAMRDPNPVVILVPGTGMFTFAKDKQTARVAAEFYINAINVMRGAEAVSQYSALPRQEAFDIEYWLLEEAKLKRMPKPRALSGKIALVTGSAGGIGKAISKKLAEEGACIILNDNDAQRLESTAQEFSHLYGTDGFVAHTLDVTRPDSIELCFREGILAFGGIDILVNCAGLSISKPLEKYTEKDWDLLYDVLVKGQFLVTQQGVQIMRKQGSGGDIINIVSKNALVSGPNNAAYGSAKAAQLHLSRLNAAELGADQIRVNVVNPDAVIADSKIWEGAWAQGRAEAYGIKVEELPAYYAKRTLLNQVILPEDIANACFALVGGLLAKSTGNVLNVDGGIAMAFVR
jgi:rhamnulose-1-phosphate aldolase/alcohol dehydrogenase